MRDSVQHMGLWHSPSSKHRLEDLVSRQQHPSSQTEEKQFEGSMCEETLSLDYQQKDQQLVHSKEKKFSCMECEAKFTQKRNLTQHHKYVHLKEKSFQCEVCSKWFCVLSSLKKHLLTHTYEKLFACDFCGKKFTQNDQLRRHRRIHTREKGGFTCRECERNFTEKSSLTRHHNTVHLGRQPFQCKVCAKFFGESGVLKKHLLTHTKEKAFECAICKRTFARKSSLEKHREKKCSKQCGEKMMTFEQMLASHHRKIHPGLNLNPFPSEMCSQVFLTAKDPEASRSLSPQTEETLLGC